MTDRQALALYALGVAAGFVVGWCVRIAVEEAAAAPPAPLLQRAARAAMSSRCLLDRNPIDCPCDIDGPHANNDTPYLGPACERGEQPLVPGVGLHFDCVGCFVAQQAQVANTRCPTRRSRRAAVLQLIAHPPAPLNG